MARSGQGLLGDRRMTTSSSFAANPDDGIRTCAYCLWDISFRGDRWQLAWADDSDDDGECEHEPRISE